MRPTTADDNVFDFDALLHPGTVFEAPRDVLDHPALTLSRETRNPGILGVRRVRDRLLPVDARTCRAQEAGIDRRNLGRIARLGRWPPGRHPAESPTVSVRPNVRLRRRSFRGPDDDGRQPGTPSCPSQQHQPLSPAPAYEAFAFGTPVYRTAAFRGGGCSAKPFRFDLSDRLQ